MPNLLLKSAGILLVAALVAFAGLLFSMPELSAQEADSDGEPAATATPAPPTATPTPRPDPTITLSTYHANSGDVITVRGRHFDVSVPLSVTASPLKDGQKNITPSPAPQTDDHGSFEFEVTLPNIGLRWTCSPYNAETRTGGRCTSSLYITVYGGIRSSVQLVFVTSPSISLSADSGAPDSVVTVSGRDFSQRSNFRVTVGGIDVTPSPAPSVDHQGRTKFDIRIPGLAPGSYYVVLIVNEVYDHQTIFTVVNPPTPTPTPAPTATPTPPPTITLSANSGAPGDTITLRGEGFKTYVSVRSVLIGGEDIIPWPPPTTNSQGLTEFDLLIPGVSPGRYTIAVEVGNTTASAGFTVTSNNTPVPTAAPTPTITLSANSGEPGSPVTGRVEGAKSYVLVRRLTVGFIDVMPQPAPATNAQGVFEFEITIPGLDAGRHTIEVEVSGVTVSAGFTVLDPSRTITLSQTSGAPGETITLRGEGFEPYVPVQLANFSGIDVLPSPAPSTDAQGRTEFEIIIPGLDPGWYYIFVKVSGSSSAQFEFTVTAASAPTPTPRPTATPTPTPAPTTEPPQLPGSSEPPHIFTGTATLNGGPAGQGVAIDAYDSGRRIGATVTQAGGRFSIHVHRAEGVITFRVNNQAAAESWTAWQRGQVTTGFDLTAGGDNSRETDPARLFAALPDLVRAFGFDNATKRWDFFDPAAAEVSTLTRFMPSNIYWLLVSRTTRLMLNGVERDLFCVEDDCWNLIAW